MKKTMTILSAIILCFLMTIVCLGADKDHGKIILQRNASYQDDVTCTIYEDGTVILSGEGEATFENFIEMLHQTYETLIIGKDITSISDMWEIGFEKFLVDEKSPYFSVDSNGVLYNKDKTELVAIPCDVGNVYTVPEGVKTLKAYCLAGRCFDDLILAGSVEKIEFTALEGCKLGHLQLSDSIKTIPYGTFYGLLCESVVIPESVKSIDDGAFEESWRYGCGVKTIFVMNPDCVIDGMKKDIKIVGYSNSEAEKFAKQNGNAFESLDVNHKHIFLSRIIKAETCTEDGLYSYYCPCDKATVHTKVVEAPGHHMNYDNPAADGNVYCRDCGAKADCKCFCHKALVKNASPFTAFIYKVVSFFWKLFHTNEKCRCGNSYHY